MRGWTWYASYRAPLIETGRSLTDPAEWNDTGHVGNAIFRSENDRLHGGTHKCDPYGFGVVPWCTDTYCLCKYNCPLPVYAGRGQIL